MVSRCNQKCSYLPCEDPADKTNNQNYYHQICRILDVYDKCHHFDLITSIYLARIDLQLEPSKIDENKEDDNEPKNLKTATLIDSIMPVSNIVSGPCIPFNLFQEATHLTSGVSNVVLPLCTFTQDNIAFHLPHNPHITKVIVDQVTELFQIPDL